MKTRRRRPKQVLAALWLKAVIAPLEVLQRRDFQRIAAHKRGTQQPEGK